MVPLPIDIMCEQGVDVTYYSIVVIILLKSYSTDNNIAVIFGNISDFQFVTFRATENGR